MSPERPLELPLRRNVLVLLLAGLTSCGGGASDPPAEGPIPPGVVEAAGVTPDPMPGDPGVDPVAVLLDSIESTETPPPEPLTWSEETLVGLSLEERAGQLIMPWVLGDFAPEGSASHERIFGMIEDQKVGAAAHRAGGISCRMTNRR